MSANPQANGGLLLATCECPTFAILCRSEKPGATDAEATRTMGKFLRDVMKLTLESRLPPVSAPDENNSKPLQDAMEVTIEPEMLRSFLR